MSSKRGDSFEARIALLLSTAGFTIKEQPHLVKFRGKTIGDLDVLAQDPQTRTVIGVSCKEWFGSTPGSEQFSHFVEMLEMEKLRHGIFASATKIPDTIRARLEFTRQKGLTIIALDSEKIKKLERFAHANQRWQVEDYFRNHFNLGAGAQDTDSPPQMQKTHMRGDLIECDNLIPVNYFCDAPEYIENRNFVFDNAVLSLDPYLVIEYSLHIEARHPSTSEVLDKKEDTGAIFVDTVRGSVLTDRDPIAHQLKRYCHGMEVQGSIQEDGFTVKKNKPRINPHEYTKMLQTEIATKNEIRANYRTARDEKRQLIKKAKPSDVRILSRNIVHLPVWNVNFVFGGKTYRRSYFGHDGEVIIDEMRQCSYCKSSTRILCNACFSLACEGHGHSCTKCSLMICEECMVFCSQCKASFCSKHKPSISCAICRSLLCDECGTTSCKTCQKIVCIRHRTSCARCRGHICDAHALDRRYARISKKFCSDQCIVEFTSDYDSSGTLGKFRRILGK